MNPLKHNTDIMLLLVGHALVAVALFCALPPEDWAWTSPEEASSPDEETKMFVYNFAWRLLAGVLAAQAGLLALWMVFGCTSWLVKLPANLLLLFLLGWGSILLRYALGDENYPPWDHYVLVDYMLAAWLFTLAGSGLMRYWVRLEDDVRAYRKLTFGQFRLVHVLALVALLGLALAVGRMLYGAVAEAGAAKGESADQLFCSWVAHQPRLLRVVAADEWPWLVPCALIAAGLTMFCTLTWLSGVPRRWEIIGSLSALLAAILLLAAAVAFSRWWEDRASLVTHWELSWETLGIPANILVPQFFIIVVTMLVSRGFGFRLTRRRQHGEPLAALLFAPVASAQDRNDEPARRRLGPRDSALSRLGRRTAAPSVDRAAT